jgi:UDP-3-O-[3-hydroxymyristoyl] N-acetylglucosamine deacetylase
LSTETAEVKDHTVGCGGVWVIEHLLSALYGLEIDNIVVESPTGELPFFDGSALRFCNVLRVAIIEQTVKPISIVISDKIEICSRNTFIMAQPAPTLNIDISMNNKVVGSQRYSSTVNVDTYSGQLAPARTFAMLKAGDPRLRRLPPYGIAVTSSGIYAREPLRFGDELVRHKVLDLLGHIAVLGGRLRARISGHNISHHLNHRLVRAIAAARRRTGE